MLRIGELSEATGVSVRLLRYYEQQQLLSADRTTSGHRRYTPDSADSVRRIRLLLDAGLPTSTIRKVIPCFEGSSLNACVATYLDDHLVELTDRLQTLQTKREALTDLLATLTPAL
ncbi:MerR family transcriptional regulator [Kribbella sp. NPDC056951]|uniref:MerR family transcriptional regulator n=1 Tax=Kribbella sp. NPDC056951 TaxID=3345978 RepID=UPI0036344795